MNPETTISESQIIQLCEIHGIQYEFSKRIKVGFTNELYQINDNLILKIYLPTEQRYETELLVLQSNLKFPKPALIAHYLISL